MKDPNQIVARRPGYALHADGRLFKTGPHGYLAGYVMNAENIDSAIDAHEEELRHLMAAARREFGGEP